MRLRYLKKLNINFRLFQIATPTSEQIEAMHAKYAEAVAQLYEEYNPIYGDPKLKLVIEWFHIFAFAYICQKKIVLSKNGLCTC